MLVAPAGIHCLSIRTRRDKETQRQRERGTKKERKKERKKEKKEERTEERKKYLFPWNTDDCFRKHLAEASALASKSSWTTGRTCSACNQSWEPWMNKEPFNHGKPNNQQPHSLWFHHQSPTCSPQFISCMCFMCFISYDIPLCCNLWVTRQQWSAWCFETTYNLEAILPQNCYGGM